MNTVFVNDCAVDHCYKKNMGNGKQMCIERISKLENKPIQEILKADRNEVR